MVRIANIGDIGARRRRNGAWIYVAVGLVACAVLYWMHAPRPARLLLAVPAWLAASGFLQARAKT